MYIKNLFYKNFEKEVILKHKRVRCKSCNKSYMLTSILQVKKYLKETRKELEQKVFKIMFENSLLEYMDLTKREAEILKKENINSQEYVVLSRLKKQVNQFDKKMIKVVLLNLQNCKIKELSYKEIEKKNYFIK